MSTSQIEDLNKVLQLLEEGEEKVVLGSQKDLILILGVTSLGKSTLAQFLKGNTNLKSKISRGLFIIVGDERIQGGLESKTIFPELIDEGENVFYDCPGFEDMRGIDKDISSTYFIKKVIDHAERLKIILTMNGMSFFERDTFPKLLKHTSSLIKDVDFLNEVKEEASKKLKPDISLDERKLHKDTKKIVDALLIQKNDNYIKLGLFKAPKHEGKLFEIDSFKHDKEELLLTLKENISYVVKNEGDFGFTISENLKNMINDLNTLMNKCIEKHVSELGDNLQHYFENYIQRSNNIHELKKELEKIDIGTFKETNRHLENPKKFVQAIDEKLEEFSINLSEWNRKRNEIIKYGSYLEFLRTVKSVTNTPEKWMKGFDGIIQFIKESKQWYEFLAELYKKLSKYEIQINREKYIMNWDCGTQENNDLKIHIDKDNFVEFLEIIESFFLLPKYKYKVNDLRIDELNRLLKITLTPPSLEILKEGENLIINGDYIILSKIEDKHFKNIKFVKIFCLNTLFIDIDLSGKNFQEVNITCISPRWNTVRHCTIELNRAEGLPHSSPKAENGKNGRTNVELLHGKDGEPGLPGGTARSFFGIGRKGGPGQHGGKGGRGQDGDDFKSYKIGGKMKVSKDLYTPLHPFRYTYIKEKSRYIGSPTGQSGSVSYDEWFEVYRKDGIMGGNGGKGGKGGKEGYNGTIHLVNMSDQKEATDLTYNKQEEEGKGGIGGKGGEGGKHGNGEEVRYHYNQKFFNETIDWIREGDITNNKRAKSGKNGEDSSNEKDMKSPKEHIEQYNFAKDISNYKTYLRSNLNNRIKQGFLLTFYQELDNHPVVRCAYDTLRFFDKLEILEDQFYTLIEEVAVDTIPIYKLFLERIKEYVTSNKQYQYAQNELTSAGYKKALCYLYTIALSKIWCLKIKLSPYLVVDIYEYFKLVEENINLLEEKKEQVVLDQYKNDYKKNIDDKIKEAETFIKENIIPEIDNINKELNKKFDILIDKMIKLQEDIFSVLKIGSQVASFIEPIGAAAGAVIRSAVMISETFVLDDDNNEGKPVVIPPGVKNSLQQITTSYNDEKNKKIKILDQQLKEISEELGNYPEKLSNLNEKIKKFQNNLKIEINRKEPVLDTLKSIQKDLKLTLEKKEKSLKNEGSDVDQKTKDALIVVNHFNNIFRIFELAVDFYNKYKSNKHKVKVISDMNGMQDNIKKVEKDLQNKSHAALDVTKWQIRSTIKDVKIELHQFTKAFDIKEKIGRSERIIFDDDLRKAISRIERNIQYNIVLGQYNSAMQAFKQWVFPFGFVYQKEYRTSVKGYDKAINEGNFYKTSSMNPFAIWDNKSYQNKISQLLKGEVVTFKANISNSDPEKSAIKFNKIGIHFRSLDPEKQNDLEKNLGFFRIIMTHLGNSYYRWNNQMIVLRSREQVIFYLFEKGKDGKPTNSNLVYRKITSGD
ncbi:Macrophage receptor MARCO [Gigaspora margarita]|uniref:Macrophage receptor MARCO n=1 Tax=Gigaspora margarita TaxID=4874 RepID=A0A8H4ELU5_GIGMA|nr:Macrophage receptor MARCO [Gigaspora margarita]